MPVIISNNSVQFADGTYQNSGGITNATSPGSNGQEIFVDRTSDNLRFKRIAAGSLVSSYSNSSVIVIKGDNLFSPPGPIGPIGPPGPPYTPPVSGPTK